MSRWTRAPSVPVGVELEVLDGVPVDGELGPDAGWLGQWTESLHLGLRYGPGSTLEQWSQDVLDANPRATLSAVEVVDLDAGARGARRSALLPAETAEGGFAGPDGSLELRGADRPARVFTALAFTSQGHDVLVTFVRPEAAGPDEVETQREFFDAIAVRPASA